MTNTNNTANARTFYINAGYGRNAETVDELSSADFPTNAAFNQELRRLSGEYRLAGLAVRVSAKACKGWRE